jgi:GH24 family phage-related lysozyme (muramidase)
MTTATVRAAAEHVARVGAITPHQLAALSALDQSLTAEQRQQFTELWRAQGSPSAAADPAWLLPATKLIREFEGLNLTAYPDPATGGEPRTIGWGTTQYPDGRPVKKGDTITQDAADRMLRHDLLKVRGPGLMTLLPMARDWPAHRVAALASWAYNVGMTAVERSTLRKRLQAGQDPTTVIEQELPRWNKAGGDVMPGLTRRRAAEVALFLSQQLQQSGGYGNPLQVPWYGQLDSGTDQARRMCFSSSCAMLLQYLRPGTLKGPNGDDQYLQRVQQFGDTTVAAAQVQALQSFGVKARFTQKASFRTIEEQINRGVPVPCGYLHRGPVSAPTGDGHWLIVVGYTATHLVVHDPLGDVDLVNGGVVGSVARFARYSRKNFGPRWMVEGAGSGWAILAER